MKIGDLVNWPQGHCISPGLILDCRPAKKLKHAETAFSHAGLAVLAMMPELGNDPEWFHECELEVISASEDP